MGLTSAASAQTIVQARGADSAVDYASLQRFGPWDDRNYELTQEDLALLSDNEHELKVAVPAFYRVHLRRTFEGMLRTGEVQYPRSALPRFLVDHGGYLVSGKVYSRTRFEGGLWQIDFTEDAPTEKAFKAQKALEGEARVSSPNGAAESAIAISPVDPMLVAAGSNGPGSGQRMHFSTDGGETWSAAAALPLGGTCCDPTLEWSSDGSKVFTATLGSNVFVYRSADGGQTWDDFATIDGDPRREIGSGVDKEYLHLDRHPSSPHQDNLYLTWHQGGNIMQFARSTDMGDTWTRQSFSSDPRGIGSDITTDKTGRIYYFWPDFIGRRIVLKRSTDGGVTFENGVVAVADTEGSFDFPIPSMDFREVFIYVAAAADITDGPFANRIYASWTDSTAPTSGNPANNHARIQVAYSTDNGDTWTIRTPHETADATSVDRWHQWLSVGPDGKVYVMFYDTRQDPSRASVDAYFAISEDGGDTWSAPERLTTVTSPKINNNFEFGDYNGMDVVMDRLITVFTDNRDESGGSSQSVDIYAAGRTLDNSTIFLDGFESGDASAWSTAFP
ncbi:MAG: sialidase family protein [Acidobacteriota bacterium]